MTPDKINAVAVIKQLLDRLSQRQTHLEELWKQRKTALEQNMQVQAIGDTVERFCQFLCLSTTEGPSNMTVVV